MRWRNELKHFVPATIGIVLLALIVNLFSWRYQLVSGGMPGYALIISYLTGFSLGAVWLVLNTIILLGAVLIAGRVAGVRAIYGFIFLSVLIDAMRYGLGLEQIASPSMGFSLAVLSLQALIGALAVSLFIHHNYSCGGYGSIIPIIHRFRKISPPIFFIVMDIVLVLLTIVIFGSERGLLVLLNATIFFFAFRYILRWLENKSDRKSVTTESD